jgi:hypothetical protein
MAWTSQDCEANAALLIVRTVEMCSGRYPCLEELDLSQLEHLTSSICQKLGKHSPQVRKLCTCIYSVSPIDLAIYLPEDNFQ